MAETDFWKATPRLVFVYFEAVKRKVEREHKLRAWHAWHTAAMSKSSKMPSLGELTGETKKQPEKQSQETQIAIARTMNALFGGRVTKRNK